MDAGNAGPTMAYERKRTLRVQGLVGKIQRLVVSYPIKSTNDYFPHDDFDLTNLTFKIFHVSRRQDVATCSLQNRNADFIPVNNLVVK